MFDLILQGGTVIDGTGKPRFRADVGITDDRVQAVADLSTAQSRAIVHAEGMVVCPGFIDVHNHSDGWLLKTPCNPSKTLQGFTTEVIGLDGIGYAPVNQHTWREWLFYLRALDGLRIDEYRGWQSLSQFVQALDGQTAQNAMTHVPYANVRSLVCGWGHRPVDDFQRQSIESEIRAGMEAGAVGLSTGLDYVVQCFATTDELVSACRVTAEYRGLYVTHVRYKLGLIPALNEALEIAERSGVKLHISHLKAASDTSADEVFAWLESARQRVDLSFDVYPYQPGSTMLSYLLPYEVWEDGPLAALRRLCDSGIRTRLQAGIDDGRIELSALNLAWAPNPELHPHLGKPISDYVAGTGMRPADALCDLLIEERLAVLAVVNQGSDALINPFLQHDLYMMGSDGIFAEDGVIHPRQFGSAARLIGPLVRDRKLFSLEQAVCKLTSRAASRFGIEDRGVLRENSFADLVVFDPETVVDRASCENPQQTAVGMRFVLVNGVPVVSEGEAVAIEHDGFPGRFLPARMTD